MNDSFPGHVSQHKSLMYIRKMQLLAIITSSGLQVSSTFFFFPLCFSFGCRSKVLLLGQEFGGIFNKFPKCLREVFRVAGSAEQHSWSCSVIKAEVCNNMFTINVSAVFPSKYGCRNSPWRPLCPPYPPESFALLFSAAIGNYVGKGEMQLHLIVTLAQPGRKQKCPGE